MSEIIKAVLEDNYRQTGFKVELSGFVYVYEDSYEEGELEHVNEWELKSKRFVVNSILSNKELIKKEVIDYINKELFVDIDNDDIDYLFSNSIDNRIFWSQMCNAENNEPTETECELWGDKKIKLYTQNFDISIKINDIKVSENDMYTIFN